MKRYRVKMELRGVFRSIISGNPVRYTLMFMDDDSGEWYDGPHMDYLAPDYASLELPIKVKWWVVENVRA